MAEVRRPSVNEIWLRRAVFHMAISRMLLAQVIRNPRPMSLSPEEWEKLRFVTTYVGRGHRVIDEAVRALADG